MSSPCNVLYFFLIGLTCSCLALPPNRVFAQQHPAPYCPKREPWDGWIQYSESVYAISTTNSTPTMRTKVEDAFAKWNTANKTNCSKVKFRVRQGSESIQYVVLWRTGVFIDENNNPRPDVPAATEVQHNLITKQVLTATTRFWLGSTGYNSGNETNYHNFIFKTALHEIGHSMGLYEPQSPSIGLSVMNPYSGTNDGSVPLTVESRGVA